MTLPLLLAFELASGGFYVVNLCDSTAVAQTEPLQLDTIQAHKSKIREQYSTFLKTCQISFSFFLAVKKCYNNIPNLCYSWLKNAW